MLLGETGQPLSPLDFAGGRLSARSSWSFVRCWPLYRGVVFAPAWEAAWDFALNAAGSAANTARERDVIALSGLPGGWIERTLAFEKTDAPRDDSA